MGISIGGPRFDAGLASEADCHRAIKEAACEHIRGRYSDLTREERKEIYNNRLDAPLAEFESRRVSAPVVKPLTLRARIRKFFT